MKITDLDEGIFDLFSRGANASGLNNIGNMIGKTQTDDITVARKAQELLDQGMPQQEIIRALQQEFGVNPQAATNAIRYAEAGLLEDNFEMSPQQRMLGNIGRILMSQAEQVKDDALANTMAKVGNEMTNMGALFGPNSLKDLEKKTDVPVAVIQKLIQYGKKVHDATQNLKSDHKDGGLNDSIAETTSAGGVAAVAMPIGSIQSRNGPKKKRKSKRS